MAKIDYDSLLKDYPFPPAVKEEIKAELEKAGVNKTTAKKIIEKCFQSYLKNLMEPGEAAGIVAAQSIGEPGTQMSLPYDEKIIIREDETIRIVRIGEFVERCIDKFGFVKNGIHEICDLPVDVFALSLDQDERVYWKRITSAIRHKFEGKLIKIKTRSGRSITATPYHSFVIKQGDRIVPVEGKKLKIGDKIPAVRYIPLNCISAIKLSGSETRLDFNFGYNLGRYFAGLTDDFSQMFTRESLPEFVFSAKPEFIEGFLQGFFEGTSGMSKSLADDVSLLLTRLGIFSVKKKVGNSWYVEVLPHDFESDIVWDEIVSIEEVEHSGYVYDISVSGLETFATSEGLITHNTMRTFHYAGVAEINVTLGLPRLIEILDVRKNPSTPMMTIKLLPECAKNREKAREVANKIEATYVRDVADIEVDIRNLRIIVKPDKKALERKNLTLEEFKNKIEKSLKTEVIEEKDKLIIQVEEPSYKVLMNTFEKLKSTIVMGIKEIKRVIIRKEGDEYVLYTEGSNLKKVMKVKGVDFTRTMTNNIYEIYEVLGIEAARNAIIKEALDTLEEQGLEVDVRHIMLVADVMTADGELKQIGRHGVAGEKQSILARAAFEMTVNNLLDAAVKGDIDYLKGITENIIVGQPIKLGTGDVELIIRLGGRK